ncbi:MAG: DNA translocase FtsK 4TM domain-containing protein, partial [Alphaproteobacteria bacterium]
MALAIEAPRHPRFLPPQVARFLKLRALELAGAALLAAAAVMLTALLTYDPLDPSASMASGRAPTNWLGAPGAGAADTALRLIGLAAALPALAAAAWGWRFCVHRPPPVLWLRVALLPLAAVLAAAAIA